MCGRQSVGRKDYDTGAEWSAAEKGGGTTNSVGRLVNPCESPWKPQSSCHRGFPAACRGPFARTLLLLLLLLLSPAHYALRAHVRKMAGDEVRLRSFSLASLKNRRHKMHLLLFNGYPVPFPSSSFATTLNVPIIAPSHIIYYKTKLFSTFNSLVVMQLLF